MQHKRTIPKITIQERFWAKVEKGAGCWEWRAHRIPTGYGTFEFDGRTVGAHRVAYQLCVGPIPGGLCVCHHCDNPGCVRPDHLFVATRKENMADMVRKGRSAVGERQGHARLTNDHVVEIRRLYAAGETTYIQLANQFGVSDSVVSRIVKRQAWAHVKSAKE